MAVKKRKKRRKKQNKVQRLIVAVISGIVILLVAGLAFIDSSLGAKSSDTTIQEFKVEAGDNYSIVGDKLEEMGLIKSKLAYKLYIKLAKPSMLYAGSYPFSESLTVKEMVSMLENQETYLPNAFFVTIPEGKNIRQIAQIVADNTDNTYDEFIDACSDTEYVTGLINRYWFLSDSVLNKDIYYDLEGYLFPDTYQFTGEDMTCEEIIEMMLDRTEEVLEPFKDELLANKKYSVHQILTLASIVELEAGTASDLNVIAGIFYNRIEDGWNLGSDVTTYYAAKVTVGERDLTRAELNASNGYNTRNSSLKGLPVGPICCPSQAAIKACIEPDDNNYWYFVADKNGVLYPTSSYTEHIAIIQKLKNEGLWYEFDD